MGSWEGRAAEERLKGAAEGQPRQEIPRAARPGGQACPLPLRPRMHGAALTSNQPAIPMQPSHRFVQDCNDGLCLRRLIQANVPHHRLGTSREDGAAAEGEGMRHWGWRAEPRCSACISSDVRCVW